MQDTRRKITGRRTLVTTLLPVSMGTNFIRAYSSTIFEAESPIELLKPQVSSHIPCADHADERGT
jgi:hypothetical protein